MIEYDALCPGETVWPGADAVKEKSSPIPLSGILCEPPAALSAMVSVPFLVPLVVGSKVTPIEQLCPTDRLFPQEFDTAKSDEAVTPVMASVVVPLFFTVTGCEAPEVPTYCPGKVTLDGDNAATGILATSNATPQP